MALPGKYCLGSVSYSILVNGFPTKPIPAKKGLRQGDPMSPYLFAIDDLLMFARAYIPSVSAIFQAFTKFSKASGLEANLHKSDVCVAGVSDTAASQIVDALGIAKGSFPFKYLGVPLTTRKLSYTDCKPLIEKTVARIKSWATKFLPYAGRLQLVRSVLFGIQLYWCQIFVMPKKNKAAVLKHYWALSMKQDRLWIKWMHTYYVKHHNFWTMQVPNGLTWSMRKFWANREVFVDFGDIDQFITHGKYSIQKMYLHLRQNATTVSWKRIICNSKASPKATFIVWLALQNRLATKERLLKWNMQIDGGCVSCQTQVETLEHLFYECIFSKRVWSSVLSKIGVDITIQTWQGEIDWEAKKSRGTKPRDKICNMAFVETIYNIWLQRNSKVFKSSIDYVDVISSRIVFLIACRCDDQMRKCLV
ncbi:uncharacterized protein [Spinacia oleracea]|uniref:Reverse transcriptase domain-containing protein n=1 Tax=Spinacia oleracea TaxID=3562 RepID=A0A9R0I959_SPIOL|nr:uncharacterized protein LOC110784654 [Spinacia oleracea]